VCSSRRRRARTVFIDAGLSEAVKNEVCLFVCLFVWGGFNAPRVEARVSFFDFDY
jgi:hypothetical protein